MKLQLHVARGGRLEGEPPPPARPRHRGAAQRRGSRERLRARARDLRPVPPAHGARAARSTAASPRATACPPEFDSMVAKIIAHGRDRAEALARLRRALAESAIVVEGGTTNRAFLLELLDRPEVPQRRGRHGLARERALARAGAASARRRRPRAGGDRGVRGGARPRAGALLRDRGAAAARDRAATRAASWSCGTRGSRYRAQVLRRGVRGSTGVEVDGRRVDVQVERLGRFERWLTAGGSAATASSPSRRARSTSSRWTAFRTASPAPTLGIVCAHVAGGGGVGRSEARRRRCGRATRWPCSRP